MFEVLHRDSPPTVIANGVWQSPTYRETSTSWGAVTLSVVEVCAVGSGSISVR